MNEPGNLPILDITYASSRLDLTQQAGSILRMSLPDAGSVDYQWVMQTLAGSRPITRVVDKGTEGTQCSRLSVTNNLSGNEVFI